MKTYTIAEAGANHDQNYDQAIKLIDIAKESGADCVKFQTYSSETLYSKNTPDFANYKNINQLIKDIELPREWQGDLKKYCDLIGIDFMSTPFDEKAVEELCNIGVKCMKISGFESCDFRFVEMVASTGLPLIISIGIGFPTPKLYKIMEICNKYGNLLTLLHCNNAYPTPLNDINLETIKYYKKVCGSAGLSDHTTSTFVPSLAVAMGANVIEKHFTLDKTLSGPDHAFALEPNELKEMIDLIKKTELCLTSKEGAFTDSEKQFISAKRSIVAKTNIKKGDILTTDNITTKRPYLDGNIPAFEFEYVLGKPASSDYNIDDFIQNVKF
jgi:N,N'-diacetyllegionaminate synthase